MDLSNVTLDTAFDPAVIDYSAGVGFNVMSTTVTAATHPDANHVIKLGGVEDNDGVIDLAEGENVITVEVTAEDPSFTRTYTVTVTRAADVAPILSSLELLPVPTTEPAPAFTPAFASNLAGPYAANVTQAVTAVTVRYTKNDAADPDPVITPTDSDDGRPGHQVDLTAGRETTITVRLTSQGGQLSTTYTVVVTRQSDDATLASLAVNYGVMPVAAVLDPAFDPAAFAYDTSVPHATTQFTVEAAKAVEYGSGPAIEVWTPASLDGATPAAWTTDEDGAIPFAIPGPDATGVGETIRVRARITSRMARIQTTT